MPIQILPEEVASQIAAGEVVERPASVVKELIENALDAGADQLQINVEGAGKHLIQVFDNGSGIPTGELVLAVERHATSKLYQSADLFHITTLGFRGEALASIGSISRLVITSRSNDSEMGARLQVDGGHIGEVQLVGVAKGTEVQVRDLFYNVPARLKFLKSDLTERRNIDNLVTRYALAYPNVRFHLQQDGRTVLQTSGNGKRREVLAALYGAEIARQMLEVLAIEDDVRVEGFISPTSVTRSNRKELHFFVNGRPVQDQALNAALLKGYHTLLMSGRFPIALLFLSLAPEKVDVNVHPTKAEVRFSDPDQIFVAVQGAVRRALLAHTPVPGLEGQLRWGTTAGSITRKPWEETWRWQTDESATSVSSQVTTEALDTERSIIAPGEAAPGSPALPHPRVPILRLVGQIASAYLVAEGPDGLYLIDQHAAHERVLFEKMLSQRGEHIPMQRLLQPVTVELPPAKARLVEEQLPWMSKLGFDVEVFGLNTFILRAIPAILAQLDPRAALLVLVEEFEEDETPLQSEVEARIAARVCKRAAVKAGQTLTPEEQRALLSDLEACESPRTCPHGRPTMIHLSVDLLERQFGRRGPR